MKDRIGDIHGMVIYADGLEAIFEIGGKEARISWNGLIELEEHVRNVMRTVNQNYEKQEVKKAMTL